MIIVANVLNTIGFTVQLVLLFFLLRGPLRRYSLLFLYCIAELSSGIANEYVIRHVGRQSSEFTTVFYTGEAVVDILLVLIVITFTYQAMEGSPSRAKVGRLLGVILAAVIVLPFLIYRDRPFSRAWYNGAVQLFNFGATIMNLVLWTDLIGRKPRDSQLLTVTAGLGVAVAGAALGWGMRKLTNPVSDGRELANIFIVLVYIAKYAIWCWAFRPQPKAPSTAVPKFS